MAKAKNKNTAKDMLEHITITEGPQEIEVDENGNPVFSDTDFSSLPEGDDGVADGSGFNPD